MPSSPPPFEPTMKIILKQGVNITTRIEDMMMMAQRIKNNNREDDDDDNEHNEMT